MFSRKNKGSSPSGLSEKNIQIIDEVGVSTVASYIPPNTASSDISRPPRFAVVNGLISASPEASPPSKSIETETMSSPPVPSSPIVHAEQDETKLSSLGEVPSPVPKAAVGVPFGVSMKNRLARKSQSGRNLPTSEGKSGENLTASEKRQLSSLESARRLWISVNNGRIDKWLAMFKSWDEWQKKNPERLKERCRKGIPDAVRGTAWLYLTGAYDLQRVRPGLYQYLLKERINSKHFDGLSMGVGADIYKKAKPPVWSPEYLSAAAEEVFRPCAPRAYPGAPLTTAPSSLSSVPSPVDEQPSTTGSDFINGIDMRSTYETIERDINRTFPHHSFFQDDGGAGQAALFRVLVAYARFAPHVGYCQGMGFIAGLMLSYLSEEEAFFCLVAVMHRSRFQLELIFANGLPLVEQVMHTHQGLLSVYVPRLHAHLEKLGVHPSMYLTQWILTVFAHSFPFPLVVRIWDAFLFEGWKVVFRVSLGILRQKEKEILAASSFEDLMIVLKAIPNCYGQGLPGFTIGNEVSTNNGKEDAASNSNHENNNVNTSGTGGPLKSGRSMLQQLAQGLMTDMTQLDVAEELLSQSVRIPVTRAQLLLLVKEYLALKELGLPTCDFQTAGKILKRGGEANLPKEVVQKLQDPSFIRKLDSNSGVAGLDVKSSQALTGGDKMAQEKIDSRSGQLQAVQDVAI